MRRRLFLWSIGSYGLAACLGNGLAVGQERDPASAPTPTPAPAPASAPAVGDSHSVTDLSTRFRFVEQYDTAQVKSTFEQIGQYRVVTRDTIKMVTEKSQGAPDRSEATQDTDYRERPANVAGDGREVRATVRAYDAYRLNPNPNPTAKPSQVPTLKGLAIWFQTRPGNDPLILSVSQGRGLREGECTIIRREVFLPELTELLPAVPCQVGDHWSVSRGGTHALMGSIPLPLTGTLQQVRQAAEGPNWEAVIGISGRSPSRSASGSVAVNARLIFSFPPPAAAAPAPAPATGNEPPTRDAGEKLLAAHGAVVELRMATSMTTPLPPSGRLRQTVTRELIVDRRLADPGEPLPLPDAAPTATEENSWLSYDDPDGKFHFRYPQDFRVGRPPDELSMELFRPHAGGPDTLEIQRIIKTGDAEADRLNRDPEFHLKMLKEEWRQSRYNVIPGPHAWLPEADWAETNRKVYRAESVLKGVATPGKPELRVHNDFYFVLFGRSDSLIVTSNTVQDPATPYRKQVEAIIKTFNLGPSDAH